VVGIDKDLDLVLTNGDGLIYPKYKLYFPVRDRSKICVNQVK